VDSVPTRYLDRDGASFAYQVIGSGPTDLVVVAEMVGHLDLMWTDPYFHRLVERVASSARMLVFQRRGFGLSDPVAYQVTLEQQAADILAVMDDVGVRSAMMAAPFSLCGGPVLVAATNPDRVQGLVLMNPFAAGPLAPSAHDVGYSDATIEMYMTRYGDVIDHWGSGRTVDVWDPGQATGYNRRLAGILERCSATPSAARAHFDWTVHLDLVDILRAVRVPTRVLRIPGNFIPEAVVRRVAELIEGAQYVVLPETPHGTPMGEAWMPYFDHIFELATGHATRPEADRFLGTVLFTDIVDSTQLLSRLGDAAYRDLHAAYERLVQLQVDRQSGRLVNVTGDGTFSIFDSPSRAVRCAAIICTEAAKFGIEVRAGLHSGELEYTHGRDVTGMTVHIGARVAAAAGAGEVLVSRTVRDLAIGSGLQFRERGVHALKGVPGTWDLHALAHAGEPNITASSQAPAPTVMDRAALSIAQRAPRLARRLVGAGNAWQRRRSTAR
jgi:class 3 adenylate cyclase/pimeloyl-ACP methyl ester carboxylesterase